ncbi:ACT domain-containing protein [Candidatus Bathyarchaeota archaeon]|nr:ACT domain-containing protein [Candidatus Bathyarchaeota archaeon]
MKHLFESSDAEGPYSAITFDIVLDLSLVGFLSVVSAVLAEAGISIYALSTYLRDYIFVQSSHADEAVRKLDELIMRCRDQKLL